MTESYANTGRGFNINYVGLNDFDGIAKDGDYKASFATVLHRPAPLTCTLHRPPNGSSIVALGVNDKLDFSDPAKLRAVEVFRNILHPDRTDIKIFLPLTPEVFYNAANLILHKFK